MTNRSLSRALSAVSVAVISASGAHAFSGGAPEGFSGSPASGTLDCTICHAEFGVNTGPGAVAVLGLPPLYVPDQVYTLRVRVEDATKAGAGFELSVEDTAGMRLGQLAVTDALNTRNAGSGPVHFVTQTSAGKQASIADWAAMGGAAEFTVQWTAPSSDEGEIGFYAAGNAINNATASSGDEIYTVAEFRSAAVPGDLNGDGAVDTADLGMLIARYGTPDPVADISNDGVVGTEDLSILLNAFGN
ncbi:MAG: hypothetical protein H6814_08665 [Phycisphaeraceae bacterium]|nr:hypothetical protein [Phycisphaeraceae bacterium]